MKKLLKGQEIKRFSRYLLILLIALILVGTTGCKPPVVQIQEICPGCNAKGESHPLCETCGGYTCIGNHNHGIDIEIKCPGCKQKNIVHQNCEICGGYVCVGNHNHNTEEIIVRISGSSEIRSGNSIQLQATVIGTKDDSVVWEVTKGKEYVSITSNGVLTAKHVDENHEVEVCVKSLVDETAFDTRKITVLSKPELTQSMLDVLKIDKIGFEGYIKIDLYTIGIFETFYQTYTTAVKTAMDGTNWFAEYDNADTGLKMGIYYKNYNNLACQVGVSFMNDEQYTPLIDENGLKVSWIDSGLYNNLKNLTVNDFTFDEVTWSYIYTGIDKTLIHRVAASANPYDFVATNLSLIIEDGEIMGVRSKGEDSFKLAQGYRAEQELSVVINTSDSVTVPTISKYQHDPIHDNLTEAINHMHALESYNLDFKEITASVFTSGYTESGWKETITKDICHFIPYTVSYFNGTEIRTPRQEDAYGYKKINEKLYNSYFLEDRYVATRAYEKDFSNAKPSFAFAAEIFTSYSINEEDGTITYYVDKLMSSVASTFYYGVGNDIALYGIYATEGKISETQTFTPFVVVKDGYIVQACFYYYLGSMYGVVELEYSDFNQAKMPENTIVSFETKQVPTSWSELSIIISDETSEETTNDTEINALDYLKTYFENENIEEIMPFFGKPLGDTYGYGLTTIHMPGGSDWAREAIVFYYDVPLDIDYSIKSSLDAVNEYLSSLGFIKNGYDEFEKDGICVSVVDSSLDLMIYVWKK